MEQTSYHYVFLVASSGLHRSPSVWLHKKVYGDGTIPTVYRSGEYQSRFGLLQSWINSLVLHR